MKKLEAVWSDGNIMEIDGFRFYFPSREDYIAATMARKNLRWESHIMELILPQIDESSTVIDAGAHYGLWSIPLSKRVRQVVSIEPINYSVLAANLDLNQVLNVLLIPLAANHNSVDRFSVAEFCEEKRRENSGATYLVPDKSGVVGGVMIDDVVADLPSDTRISLIKYDVEEMEFEAVLGSFGTIKKHRPVLYVEECDPAKRKFHYKLSFLLRLLDILDYRRSKDHREIWIPSENRGE